MNTKELEQEASKLIADRIQNNQTVQMTWAVQELINKQGIITGEGVPFYDLCAREFVYKLIKKAVNRYETGAAGDSDSPQMTLEGYDYLQEAYTVVRDEERQLVPVGDLTDEELLERASDFRKQSLTLIAHADDIDSYVAKRKGIAAVN